MSPSKSRKGEAEGKVGGVSGVNSVRPCRTTCVHDFGWCFGWCCCDGFVAVMVGSGVVVMVGSG